MQSAKRTEQDKRFEVEGFMFQFTVLCSEFEGLQIVEVPVAKMERAGTGIARPLD